MPFELFGLSVLDAKKNSIALKDSQGNILTYAGLADYCRSFGDVFRMNKHSLVLLLCDNTVASATFFLGCLHSGVVPLMLNGKMDKGMLARYIDLYNPSYIYTKSGIYETARSPGFVPLYEQLSLLLPTSGSTGSPKLVRHSYTNIAASAANVAKAFRLDGNERVMLSLPIHFTQGLSVLCSHLHAGACVYLTDDALSSRSFWNAMKNEEITFGISQ